MNPIRVLFVCVHNSARSQMAAAYLKRYGGPAFSVESAGLEPSTLYPQAVTALKEDNIDISGYPIKDVTDLLKEGQNFDYVIAVCDLGTANRFPAFPGPLQKM